MLYDVICYVLHPGRLTWNLQITHLERKMIFQTSMIMFHVNLQGCSFIYFYLYIHINIISMYIYLCMLTVDSDVQPTILDFWFEQTRVSVHLPLVKKSR